MVKSLASLQHLSEGVGPMAMACLKSRSLSLASPAPFVWNCAMKGRHMPVTSCLVRGRHLSPSAQSNHGSTPQHSAVTPCLILPAMNHALPVSLLMRWQIACRSPATLSGAATSSCALEEMYHGLDSLTLGEELPAAWPKIALQHHHRNVRRRINEVHHSPLQWDPQWKDTPALAAAMASACSSS